MASSIKATTPATLAAAPDVPPPEVQIAGAVLAAPAELREGAAVIGYNAQGVQGKIREGKNEMICLASHPTKTAMEQYQIGSDELALQIPKLRKLIDTDIRNLEKQLDAAGAPPTPGRLPDWKGGK